MRELEVDPRVLADDLMFTAVGAGHRARTIRAMGASKQFFIDIGARVADNNRLTFACDCATRASLSKYAWDLNGLTIPCFSSFRDLGAHLNLTRTHNGVTLINRFRKAIKIANHLGGWQ